MRTRMEQRDTDHSGRFSDECMILHAALTDKISKVFKSIGKSEGPQFDAYRTLRKHKFQHMGWRRIILIHSATLFGDFVWQ